VLIIKIITCKNFGAFRHPSDDGRIPHLIIFSELYINHIRVQMITKLVFFIALISLAACSSTGKMFKTTISDIGPGWAKTSVNAPIFRKNSIVSGGGYQFVAYYDSAATVVLAKRKLGENNWFVRSTQYKGNVFDAHNMISIMIDGDGYLHMSWDHHNNPLNYCRSVEPYSLEMGEKITMTDLNETAVTYPEFYRFQNGDLLFAFRDGGSGRGNLVMNKYHLKTSTWERLHSNLIDGELERNAYWQIHVDQKDKIITSWVWRETPDVSTNHDLCYAESDDGGITWQNSKGEIYQLPVTQNTAEVIYPIPQNSNLINQTSMCSDEGGNAYIVTYYKTPGDSCTQFHLIYHDGLKWSHSTISQRKTDFNLSGVGSRSIPISRPQIVIQGTGKNRTAHVIYRDEEFDNTVCISSASVDKMKWTTQTVSPEPLGRWEPSYDSELWKTEKKLHLFLQNVGQGQAETTVDMEPQMVGVLELNFAN